jgi:hypothetical protein
MSMDCLITDTPPELIVYVHKRKNAVKSFLILSYQQFFIDLKFTTPEASQNRLFHFDAISHKRRKCAVKANKPCLSIFY